MVMVGVMVLCVEGGGEQSKESVSDECELESEKWDGEKE